MNTDMFRFKDAELFLSDLADILRKEYGSNEEFEKEFIPQMEHLEGIEVELTSELYRITQYMQNNGAFERWKVKGLEIAIMKYLVALHESGMAEIDDGSAFVAGLRAVRTMCERYVEILQAINEYIGEEPQHGNESNSTIELPEELNTATAEKTFTMAISKGWIEQRADGLTWVGFGSKPSVAQLAYLCGRVYGYVHRNDRNEGEHIPYKALERLFSVERLDRSLKQVYEAKSPQHWRKDMDNLFD